MKILFVCGVYPKSDENLFRAHCRGVGLQNAANTFQWALIEGLYLNNADFEVISFPFLPGYPIHYNKLFSPSGSLFYQGYKIGTFRRYNTFFLYKDFSKKRRLSIYLNKWLKANCDGNEDKIVILTYTPSSCFMNAIIPLKAKYPFIQICSIVPDLVDDATNPIFNLSWLKYQQARLEQKAVKTSYNYIEKFILLSSAMEEKIPQAHNRSIVVEGIASKIDMLSVPLKQDTIKTVLYTGTIQEFTGILNLIRAFRQTKDSNYRLIICGAGDCVNRVLELSNGDSRIEYKGSIPRDEAVALQHEATLLVNPRQPNVSLTRYSFPSKTMEYLSSGTPMLGYQLEGIPSEYYDYIYSPKDFSDEALAEKIDEILSMSPENLREAGERAKFFIHSYKEAKYQVKRIIDFLQK